MSKCVNCGAEADTKFCPQCGSKMPELHVCPSCGTQSDTKFCPECGTLMAAAAAGTSAGTQAQPAQEPPAMPQTEADDIIPDTVFEAPQQNAFETSQQNVFETPQQNVFETPQQNTGAGQAPMDIPEAQQYAAQLQQDPGASQQYGAQPQQVFQTGQQYDAQQGYHNMNAGQSTYTYNNGANDPYANTPQYQGGGYTYTEKKVPWYFSTWLIVLLFIFFWPVGIGLMWGGKRFSKTTRIVWTCIFGGLTLIGVLFG